MTKDSTEGTKRSPAPPQLAETKARREYVLVHGRDPLWSDRPIDTVEEEGEPHMPSPSGWPIIVAFGIVLTGVGALTVLPVVFAGVAVIFVSIYGWNDQP